MKFLLSAAIVLLTTLSSVHANTEIDLTPPPILFVKVTTLMNKALNTSIESEKIKLMQEMSEGLYNLPPCRIHTSNALYTVAMSGSDEVKLAAVELMEDSLDAITSNLPMPSFVMAKILTLNYIKALKVDL